jgi:hypothetical protein
VSERTLDLSTLIFAVREELEKADAQLRAAAKPTLFQLSSMELELNFVVQTSSEVGGNSISRSSPSVPNSLKPAKRFRKLP